MNSNNHGLTVGELSIAIATLIALTMIWSSFNKNEKDKDFSFNKTLTNAELLA